MAPRYWLIGSYRHEKNRNRHIEPGTGDLILRIAQEAGIAEAVNSAVDWVTG
jgi:hypothetical protein